MIKVEVIKEFTLNDFDKIMGLKRSSSKNKEGSLFVGDIFCCSKDMVDYLTGNNAKGIAVVKVIEVVPEKEEIKVEALTDNEETIVKTKPKKKSNKKK